MAIFKLSENKFSDLENVIVGLRLNHETRGVNGQ